MKYLIIFSLFLGLSWAQASDRKLEIIEAQRKNLTAYSYKTRKSALLILEKLALESKSPKIKAEVVEALQESILNFMTGGTAVDSLVLIGEIAVQSDDPIVAEKAVEVLTSKLEFSFTRSADERNTAAMSLKDIAQKYQKDERINIMIYDAFLPHIDSGLDTLSEIAREVTL